MQKRLMVLILAVVTMFSTLTGCGSIASAPMHRQNIRHMQAINHSVPGRLLDSPGPKDLDYVGADITYPKSSSYLSSYEYKEVDSPKGYGIYLFSRTPNIENYMYYNIGTLRDGTYVTVLAVEAGAACVIADDGSVGWVNADYLKAVKSTGGVYGTGSAAAASSSGTPMYNSGKLSGSLLDALGANITYPASSSYLESYAIRYVKSSQGGGVYLFSRTPNVGNYMNYMTAVIPDNTQVVMLAEEAGAGCVVTETGEIGWINVDYLKDKPTLTGYNYCDYGNVYGGNSLSTRPEGAVAVESYEDQAAFVLKDGRVSLLNLFGNQTYSCYEEATRWNNVRSLVMGFGVIAGITYDGRFLFAEDSNYSMLRNKLGSLPERKDVLDMTISSYTDIAVTCAGGEIFFLALLAGDVPNLTIPGAKRAVISFNELFVLTYIGEVYHYSYNPDSDTWKFVGLAADGVKKMVGADYNKDYAAAVLLNNGKVALLRSDGSYYYADGFENMVDIASGGLLTGCDAKGYYHVFGPTETVNEAVKQMSSWGAAKKTGVGNYYLFALE